MFEIIRCLDGTALELRALRMKEADEHTNYIIKILAEEVAMFLHISVTGPLLDQGWPMETAIAAIKRSADLLPELEKDNDECWLSRMEALIAQLVAVKS